jgi:predicted O-methyltransferase YrrM
MSAALVATAMSALARILFVDDTPAEWQLALASLADGALMEQTTVVKDKDEALDFLHERGFACRGGARSKRAQAHSHVTSERHP